MFGSRKRQPNPPLTAATANPNAATAAAAVFRRHESNSSLSVAAAAAALAARPMTPTRVAEVQTKRSLRRSASVASSAASSDTHGRPGLQRRLSSGSMTERTFRSPSPHRPASSGSGHRQTHSLGYTASEDMPPVPALPRDAGSGSKQLEKGSLPRRATSLGVSGTPLRLASQSLGSEDAPSWFGGAKMGDLRNVRRTDPAMASPPSSPPQVPRETQPVEGGRPSSRASSINFSYPTRIKVGSPPVSPVETRNSAENPPPLELQPKPAAEPPIHPPRHSKSQGKKRLSASETSYARAGSGSRPSDDDLVYDPNSRRMVRQADLRAAEEAFLLASQHPTSPRRKKQTPQHAGSHLAKGTVGRAKNNTQVVSQARTHSTNAPTHFQPQSSAQHAPTRDPEDFEEPAVKAIISSPRIDAQRLEQRGLDSATHLKAQSPEPGTAPIQTSAILSWESPRQSIKRQPSVVKEEPEPDSEPEKKSHRNISHALDAVPARIRVDSQPPLNEQESQNTLPRLNITAASSPPTSQVAPRPTLGITEDTSKFAASVLGNPSNFVHERTSSNSPVRQAHFGPVSDNLTVRHSPPPRSISPRKSALKNSGSPSRGASPSDDTSEASVVVSPREEPPTTRKKSVRVSFDDGNTVVVGESAPTDQSDSPLLASPQNAGARRPWYSSIGRSKKDLPPLDDDEIMKPRPALPSFGSVRNRKPREQVQEEEERPLVRPISEKLLSFTTQSYSPTTTDLSPGPDSMGQSSDHAVGSILAKEFDERSKIPANISRFREPLPPVVTSVEGGGYMSDTSSSSDSDELALTQGTAATLECSQELHSELQNSKFGSVPNGSVEEGKAILNDVPQNEANVPTISISEPTPPIVEKKKSSGSFFLDVPGGFPQDDSDSSVPEASGSATPLASAAKEPTPQSTTSPPTTLAPTADSSSDSESSIYSDAYEDLSEIEGDGFQSLNAVLLERPTDPKTLLEPARKETAPDHSLLLQYVQPEIHVPAATTVAAVQTAQPEDEWEKAKAFWKSLTADKRAQLEKEAAEDAAVEGDLEEVEQAPKPKKKKSVERRNSERKALAVHMAQHMMAQQEKGKQRESPERSYMIKPGTKWDDGERAAPTMMTTLRGPAQQPTVASNSNDAPRLRKSMRTSEPSANGPAKPTSTRPSNKRPVSLSSPPVAPRNSAAHRRIALEQNLQAEPEAKKASHYRPPIKRRGSSSSESSFKRSRPSLGAHVSGFRTSMRQTAPTSPRSDTRTAKRFSLRSLSPTGSASFTGTKKPPVSLTTGSQMRQTLRDSSSERKKSPSGMRMPNFGLSPRSKKAGKRTSSRFADSSDEDEAAGKSGFRSRFEDSSDDEAVSPIVLPKTLPSSLGRLRNQESLASTALPEELEESEETPDHSKSNGKPQAEQDIAASQATPLVRQSTGTSIRPTRSGPGGLASSQTAPVIGSATASKAERRNSKGGGFMSALRRKKHDSAGKITRPGITESAARLDTKLERNPSQLRGLRKPSGEAERTADAEVDDELEEEREYRAPPKSPKLQKRIVSLARSIDEANAGGHADLPSPLALAESPAAAGGAMAVAGGEEKFIRSPLRRPSATSANLGTRTMSGMSGGAGAQPGFLQHKTVSAGIMSIDAPSVAGTGQKKKKFGALRRMFGLND